MSIDQIKNKILPILLKNDVKKASLFGSIVTGKTNKKSDIDILVEFRGRKSLFDLSGLRIELEESLKRRVDVLTYNSLYPLLRERILKEQKPLL